MCLARRLGVYPTPIGPGDPGYCMDKSLGKYPLPKLHICILASLLKLEYLFEPICFFCRPSISSLRARSLGVRDLCHVRFFPNIPWKDRRDIDGSLGTSALRFGDMLCIAKLS